MSKLYEETMLGLLQAIEIARGTIPVEEVQGMPGKTFRVPKTQTTDMNLTDGVFAVNADNDDKNAVV